MPSSKEHAAAPINAEMLQQLSAVFAAQPGEDARRSSHAAAVAAAEMVTSERRESELSVAAAATVSSAEQRYYSAAAGSGGMSPSGSAAARLRQDSDECMRAGAAMLSSRGCKRQQQLPVVFEGCSGVEQQQQRACPGPLPVAAMPAHSAHFHNLHLRPAGQSAFSMLQQQQQQPMFVSSTPKAAAATAEAAPPPSLPPATAAAPLRSSARRTTTDSIGDFDSLLDGLMNDDGEAEAEQFFA